MEPVTRRRFLAASGLTAGALVSGDAFGLAALLGGRPMGRARAADDPGDPTQRYSYFAGLPTILPNTPLEDDELRVTFMGSGFPPTDRAQAEMSLFVEVGPWVIPDPVNNPGFGRATDSFVFDCGSGVSTNFTAMNVSPSRMDKVFLCHLHGDHVTDLMHLYWFGPAVDRKSPLYVWGPGPSGITCPAWGDNPPTVYDDGTRAFCSGMRDAMRWATESFSFQTTSYAGYDTPTREGWVYPDHRGPVSDDPPDDGYALVPIELDWTKTGEAQDDNLAYENPATGVRITHFPVIHCRKGSIGYRLEWNGLTLVYSSDTKPETQSIANGSGVDVFIHEMILPPDELTMKSMRITSPDQVPDAVWQQALSITQTVQNSSHTTQGAYGYLLSQLSPPPRLAVATHFPIADDTTQKAFESVREHVPGLAWDPSGDILDGGEHPAPGNANILWSADLMVLRVFPDRIQARRAQVQDYLYQQYPGAAWPDQNPPKYDDDDPSTPYGDPYAQIDLTNSIPATDPDTGAVNYRDDGW